MDKKDRLIADFLKALNEIEVAFATLHFKRHSFVEKGLAYYIGYIKGNTTRVDFLFGPSEWDIEVIIYTSKGKFAFKDLLNIPEISRWVNDNKYREVNGRNVRNELLWFIELLKKSLPMLE